MTPLRFLGLAAIPAGLVLATQHSNQGLFVDREGSGTAVRARDGRLVLLGRAPAFVVEQWLRADGDGREANDPTLRAGTRCVAIGAGGRAVALVLDRRGFTEDCRRAAVVISRLSAPESCKPAHRFDRAFLASSGAATLRWADPVPTIETSRRPRAPRPWLQRQPVTPPGTLPAPMGEPATASPSEPGNEPREDPRP
jgi:competence protein ComEC